MINTFKEFQQAIQDTLDDIQKAKEEATQKAQVSNVRYNQGVADGLDKAFGLFQEHFITIQEPEVEEEDEDYNEDDDYDRDDE